MQAPRSIAEIGVGFLCVAAAVFRAEAPGAHPNHVSATSHPGMFARSKARPLFAHGSDVVRAAGIRPASNHRHVEVAEQDPSIRATLKKWCFLAGLVLVKGTETLTVAATSAFVRSGPRLVGGSARALRSCESVAAPPGLRTARAECLDWILVLGRRHLERVLRTYSAHYNRARPHRGLELKTPERRPDPASWPTEGARVRRREMLGGLIREYEVAA